VPVTPEPSGDKDWRGDQDLHDAETARVIALTEKSGLPAYRVDAAPDGTISIVVIDPE
jgi:hypothetical protein